MPKSETDDYTHTKSSDKRRSPSRSTAVPMHFAVHKPGCHFESCCGVCNLFPGVLLIAFCQVLIGSILMTLILTHSKQYDEMHQTKASQVMSLATGAVLTGVIGAGVLLIIVALTESCRAMLASDKFDIKCYTFPVFSAHTALIFEAHLQGIESLGAVVLCSFGVITTVFAPVINHQKRGKSIAKSNLVYLLVAVMVWLGILSLAVTKIGRACVRFKDAAKIKDDQHRLANMACMTGLFTFLGAVIYLFSFVVVFSFYHFRYVRRAILLHEAECR